MCPKSEAISTGTERSGSKGGVLQAEVFCFGKKNYRIYDPAVERGLRLEMA